MLADAVFATGGAAVEEQNRAVAAAANGNAALIGAMAAAGLMAAEPLAAATDQANIMASADQFDGAAQHQQALSPIAATAVAKLQAAERAALSNDDRSHADPHNGNLHAADDAHQQLDTSGSHHADPARLLQPTEMPAHQQPAQASPFTASGVAIPSAQQLAASAQPQPADAAQHNAVVGKVLVDALHQGHLDGGTVDSLLASLPHHGDGHTAHLALAALANAHGDAMGIGYAVPHMPFAMETLAMHQDAAPHS
jgi:hypothetical protein